MSQWYEAESEDIVLGPEHREVEILVTANDMGNIYVTLTFDQIADFCGLHPLEVKAIADGDAAQGIKGMDPIVTGQLTREQIGSMPLIPWAWR